MPSLAFRKASICSRFSFSASCTLVVNPQHATRSRLILYWKLPPPSGSSCIGKDYLSKKHPTRNIIVVIPEFVEDKWYEYFLHNQRAHLLEWVLLARGNKRIFAVSAPWYIAERT